jgi:Glycosyl hydrolase family 20, domain 2/beta-N-acetylglucosaminidase
VLAAGRDGDGPAEIVLSGVDRTGTFYAAQSFRQIISRRAGRPEVAGVSVRDWPAFGIRGGMQSFYGPTWSEADDLQQIQFLAAHTMNTYFYRAPASSNSTTPPRTTATRCASTAPTGSRPGSSAPRGTST